MTKEHAVLRVVFMLCLASGLSALSLLPAYGDEAGLANDGGGSVAARTEWTIVATYPIPEGASGLAHDGTYLYFGIYGPSGSDIYRLDPATGDYVLLFSGPQEDAYGLTHDGQYLWTTDHPGSSSTPAVAMQLDWSGGPLSQFDLPTHYMSGIAYDHGDFWVAQYYPDPGVLYKVDSSGTILDQFTAPDDQPWDLCIEGGNLWMADYYGDTLYQIDAKSGTVLFSHASEGSDPAGIVWDGDFLWYCDNGEGGNDYLYKVDLEGSGAPQINIPDPSHDFGAVTIGDPVTWYVTVENLGPADLNISAITFDPPDDLSSPDAFPVVIPPTDSGQLTVVYAPDDFAPLAATATVHSNDPLHPEEELTLTGHAVYPGPTIDVLEGSHDYGSVRVNAHPRWLMEIRNDGSELLTISDIISDDPHFYVGDTVSLPLEIDTLASVPIPVWFSPDSDTSYSGTLSISSNDPGQNPAVVPCSGTGLCTDYTTGQAVWSYLIDAGYDNSPKAIAPIPDVSGDGIADVIVASEDDFIRCFNGSSDGTADVLWEHEIYVGALYTQNALQIIEDLDDDGYHDVVVGAAWSACLIRALSGRTGQTIWTHDTHEYGGGGWVYQVHCRYDYNDDGVTDVLAATGDDATDTGPKRAYCLDGLTGASIWERPLLGPGFAVIGVEDFTGDGQPDAVAGASDEDEEIGRAVGIDGADGSLEWTFVAAGSSIWALEQIDDITADGVPDVIVGDFGGVVYGLDATDGGQVYSGGGFYIITRFERLDDVNSDGHPDILPAHFGTAARAIDGQTGDPIWTALLADKPASVARIADVTGDGVNDALIGTVFTNNYVYLLDGKDGSAVEVVDYGTPVDAIGAIPDIVGEGYEEIVAGGRNGLLTCMAGSNGNPCLSPPTPVSECPPPDDRRKNRFITFLANNPGAEVSIQVELVGVGPAECYENDPSGDIGMKWWVTPPVCTDVNGVDVTAEDPDCTGDYQGVPNLWRSQLTTDIQDPMIWPDTCIYLADCEVIPLADYDLRATFDPYGDPPLFSDPVRFETIRRPGSRCWADCVGEWDGSQWTPPNGVVNMDDVQAAVFCFLITHPSRPQRDWIEISDQGPNMVPNFTDILHITLAFKGGPYPFSNPGSCPPEPGR